MVQVLQKFVEDCKSNIPGFIAVTITDMESGVNFIADSVDKNFDPTLASAYELEIAKAEINALKALGLQAKGEEIKDILTVLTNQIHIIDIATSQQYFVYLVVDAKQANLGMTRALLSKFEKEDLSQFKL